MAASRGALDVGRTNAGMNWATGGNALNERDIWAASERLDLLFSLFPTRIQRQRANSHLRSLTSDYMDYIKGSDLVSDTRAEEIGRAILGVFRVVTSIESLYGRPIDSDIKNHDLFQEIERLFDNSERGFEGPEFTLFTATHIKIQTQEAIAVVPEMGKRAEKTPDLCVPDLCYLECKDLSPASAENGNVKSVAVRSNPENERRMKSISLGTISAPTAVVCASRMAGHEPLTLTVWQCSCRRRRA
jgi:hypothetical protein